MSTKDVLTDLAACLCAEVDAADTLCFCGVLPGQQVAMDYNWDCNDGCGMAWVRLVTSYPASGLGIQSETATQCASLLGLDVELGVFRCLPIGPQGEPPTEQEYNEAAARQADDMEAIRRAVACCAAEDVRMGQYQPVGPSGGVVGGFWVVYLAI